MWSKESSIRGGRSFVCYYFQIASCICLSTPGYMHETIHIFHHLFFITLSVTDVICDFGCFITLSVISVFVHVHFQFMIVLFFY